jgi:uncharacterized protein YceH (UPF0502 family)
MQRDDGPFVTKLPREPGKRETRYAHLFGGELEIPDVVEPASAHPDPDHSGMDADRITDLEQVVRQLREELETIKARLGIND